MKLSDLRTGETGVIVKVAGHGGFRKRIVEMGFIKGKRVKVVLNAPLRDPIEYEIMGYKISLRREEANLVEVVSESEALSDDRLQASAQLSPLPCQGCDPSAAAVPSAEVLEERMRSMAEGQRRVINVALVGNPNCGKTSLFNIASGSHEHVGNYSGVTVDAKEGFFKMKVSGKRIDQAPSACSTCALSSACGKQKADCKQTDELEYTFRLVDLPGTYSLTAYSPEELYVRRHLIDQTPDVVINVVDSTNLERNLYLTTQLVDMNLRIVTALNMYDEVRKNGDRLDYEQLGHLFGIPMVPTVSRTGEGIRELFEKVVAVYENPNDPSLQRHIHVNHGAELEQSIDRVKVIFQKNKNLRCKYSTRYLAIKFLEGDAEANKLVESLPEHDELIAARFEETQRIQDELSDSIDNAITDAKYAFIQGALRETYQPHAERNVRTLTERIDRVVTSKWLGFPLFFVLLFLVFDGTFVLGAYPQDWINWLIEQLSAFLQYAVPDGMLKDLLIDGVVSGVGSVIVFLPNILILYLFLSILEDTGYMARAAFITDKLMHKLGLHGKSFIPMVMGFGCNVPAIMATRTIENPKSRLITMLITPFMSCSARIPIYVVLIGAFFPQYGAWVLISLYALGILASIVMARLFSRFLVHGEDLPFVMELPPYRFPTARSVVRHTWEKGRQYLQKMGGIILVFSIVIWALNYFPHTDSSAEAASPAPSALTVSASQGAVSQQSSPQAETAPQAAPAADAADAGSQSYLARIGRFISPVMSPMHFDWKMSVGILSGIGAKELVVSTLAVMYAGEDVDTGSASSDTHLITALRQHISPESALAYLVFVLFYFPCFATIAAIRNESGGWKWAIFAAVYTTVFAYFASWLTYAIAAAFM